MKELTLEMSPGGADLPFYINMATGDAKSLYLTYSIASLDIKQRDGSALPVGLGAVVSAFSGSQIQLQFPAATAGTYSLRVIATLTGPSPTPHKDYLFLTLYVRTP